MKFLNVLLALLVITQGIAQDVQVVYPKPLQYQKKGQQLVVRSELSFAGMGSNIRVELDGQHFPGVFEKDRYLLDLPLIGRQGELVIRSGNKVTARTSFAPIIPEDWGYFANGAIHIISSSHQDIAWMNTPDSCREERIHKIILPAMEMMEANPDFKFGMEQNLNLMELLEADPGYKEKAIRTYQSGQFGWGATFNQPYEGMETSEQLVRQLYLGRKWMHDHLDGKIDAFTAFNVDVPGRTRQFPQILRKSGVKNLFISRFKEGFYNWYSPDGSKIFTYSPGNYGWAVMFYKYFNEDAASAMNKLNGVIRNWDDYYRERNIPPHYAVVISNDAEGPVYYKEVLKEWNSIRSLAGKPLPALKYSTADEFLQTVNVPEAKFDSISGERPNLWLYIHGPAHYEAIRHKRLADVHLTAAEKFSAIDALLKNDVSGYPKKQLDSAWFKSIYSDHGWGGKNGHITDSIFEDYIRQGNTTGERLLKHALTSISSGIETQKRNAVVVFNDLSWKRESLVYIPMPSQAPMEVVDSAGKKINSQVLKRADTATLVFLASVPGTGYTTYYVQPAKNTSPGNNDAGSNYYENSYYRAYLTAGGIKSLFDKQLQAEVINSTKFAGGDVMEMGYDGNGAGEFTVITTPNMRNFSKLSNVNTTWKLIANGPLVTVFEAKYILNEMEVVQRIRFHNNQKKIDFEYDLPHWKGIKNRQLRFALPILEKTAEITYDVPMGVSTVGKDELKNRPGGWAWGGTYWNKPEESHPREVQNFVSANASKFGLTMSSAISTFDWIDPTVDAVHYPVLQAVMLSSHKSCHGEGNWYLQAGAHSFRFSITTHTPGWKNGYAFGIENNHPFFSVGVKNIQKGKLPASMSFVTSDSPFSLVTCIKKADNDNDVVVRMVNMLDSASHMQLQWFRAPASIRKTDLIENVINEGKSGSSSLMINAGKNSIETYRLKF